MRRRASFAAALLLLLALSLSFVLDGAAQVDAHGQDGEVGEEEATNTVGLEFDDDYDPAVGKGVFWGVVHLSLFARAGLVSRSERPGPPRALPRPIEFTQFTQTLKINK